MRPPRKRSTPSRERRRSAVTYPGQRTRRRWPRAFDGVPERRADRRYADEYEEGPPIERRPRGPRGLRRVRESPLRHGLVGLAIAGVAAPIAIDRYQQALRTDPSHETRAMKRAAEARADDRAVMERWAEMAAVAEAEASGVPTPAQREATIQRNMSKHAEFRITRSLAEQIHDAAVDQGIDPNVAFGLVRAESGFRNQATSPVGAVGLTQLMPRTAAWMQPGVTRADLRNPETNLSIGFKYLNYLLDKYSGDEDLALLAYNRGPGTVDRILRNGGNPDNGYASFVRGEEDHGHTLYSRR
jgi:soluble lytic murein transglycosylase-like protein